MSEYMWQNAVEQIKPHVVKIITPSGSGTGFQIYSTKADNLCTVATAAHVINHAHNWEEPIRIQHEESQTTILLRHEERVIIIDAQYDTAAIIFPKDLIPFPDETLTMTTEGKYVKIGNELGWIGYPAVSPMNLCFFSGRASCWLINKKAYLVDGVAINGVSGGPTFLPLTEKAILIAGVVSAYVPNRATGDTLPGVCIVQDVQHFHDVVKRFRSMDEAKKEETAPTTPAPEDPVEPQKYKKV